MVIDFANNLYNSDLLFELCKNFFHVSLPAGTDMSSFNRLSPLSPRFVRATDLIDGVMYRSKTTSTLVAWCVNAEIALVNREDTYSAKDILLFGYVAWAINAPSKMIQVDNGADAVTEVLTSFRRHGTNSDLVEVTLIPPSVFQEAKSFCMVVKWGILNLIRYRAKTYYAI